MQREAARLYQSLQLDQLNCTSLIAKPDHALPCGFPFFNHCRDLRLLCNEVDLFYRSLNMAVPIRGPTFHVSIESTFLKRSEK